MAYGLTPTGFVIKPFSQIQSEIQADMQSIFGTSLDVSNQSIAGQWINEMAQKMTDLWELAQALYSGYNPNTASGAALDDACARVNVTRLVATSTIVKVMLYGTVGTVIPTGHLVYQNITKAQFACSAGITLATSISGDITINVSSVQNNYTYSITVNGTPYTYLSSGSATAVAIIAGLLAALGTIANITILSPTTTTLRLYASDGSTAFNCVLGTNLGITALGCPASYAAVVAGSVSVPLYSIQNIVNAISGLASVNNLVQGVAGRNLETDDALRVRRVAALSAIGKATDGAIAFRILQNVAGVTSCAVISNRLDVTDSSGRPPHSFEVIVSGGSALAIANEIWADMPSGIQTYGNTSQVIQDSLGANHTIYYSIPTNIYIWLQITLTFYSEEQYPTNGDALVTAAIEAWSLTEFIAGKDVIIQRILSPIYTIDGIGSATILAATSLTPGGPPGAYSGANIAIASNQLAVFDPARISVTP